MRTRRRVKVNPRFYLILLLALGLVVLTVLFFKPGGKSGVLSAGSQELSLTASAVIIRAESCISVEKYDRVTYQVAEGAQVNAEMPVATVYKWGYTDDMTQSLLTVQQQIYAKQIELLGGVENPELSAVNAQVAQKQQDIRNRLSNKPQGIVAGGAVRVATEGDAPVSQPQAGTVDLLTLENDLKALLAQRGSLLRQCVQADEALNALYAEEEAKRNQLAEYTSEVSSKGSGVASFYFDGYEQVLNAEKLDVVNADIITKVLGNAAGGAVAGSENLLFRLVNPNHWYLAFVTPRDQPLRVCAGQAYGVRVEGYGDRQFMGTALEPVVNENGVVNLLEFSEDMGDLISVRAVKATLSAQVTGLKAPLAAIGFENGVPVLPVNGNQVPLNVLSVDEDTAIIAAKEGGSLEAGVRYGK